MIVGPAAGTRQGRVSQRTAVAGPTGMSPRNVMRCITRCRSPSTHTRVPRPDTR